MRWFKKRPPADGAPAPATAAPTEELLYTGDDPDAPASAHEARGADPDFPEDATLAEFTMEPPTARPAPAAPPVDARAPGTERSGHGPGALGSRLRSLIPGRTAAASRPAEDPPSAPAAVDTTGASDDVAEGFDTSVFAHEPQAEGTAPASPAPAGPVLVSEDPSAEELEAAAVYAERVAAETPAAPAAPSAAPTPRGLQSLYAEATPAAARAARKPGLFARFRREQKDEPGYLPDWRRGAKGRPSQLFIGFMPEVSKKDAIAYAIGLANKHAVNLVNTAYTVHAHHNGWAYEVHEGGPRRAYLPVILKLFEEQTGGPITDESLVTIETAGRRVQIERTQGGLKAYQMPESYTTPQTAWLEPGPRLTPAVPLRFGLVVVGGVLFATGFLALLVTLVTRPAPPPLNAPAKQAVPFASLPISQWQALVDAANAGYTVDSLKWVGGQWLIDPPPVGDATTPARASAPPGAGGPAR